MPSKKTALRVYVTWDEYRAIAQNAARAGVSMFCFAKRVCLGTPVPSRTDQQFRRELLRVNADLGRLGGLFKLCLSDKDSPFPASPQEIRRLLREIEARQRELKALVARV